jgi:hypothetical protein
MKFIKITPQFDLCDQLDGDLFQESNVSCPLEEGPVTLIARKYIPEDVPKVSVAGNITLTNQDGETLTCIYPNSGSFEGHWLMGRCAYRCGIAVEGREESVLVLLSFGDTCHSVLAVVLLFFRSSEAEDDGPSVLGRPWIISRISGSEEISHTRAHIDGIFSQTLSTLIPVKTCPIVDLCSSISCYLRSSIKFSTLIFQIPASVLLLTRRPSLPMGSFHQALEPPLLGDLRLN